MEATTTNTHEARCNGLQPGITEVCYCSVGQARHEAALAAQAAGQGTYREALRRQPLRADTFR